MRSSDCKHFKNAKNDSRKIKNVKARKKVRALTKIGSFVVTAFIVISAMVIPSITLIQNVEALTVNHKTKLSIGDTNILNSVVRPAATEETAQPISEAEAENAAPVKEAVEEATEEEIVYEETCSYSPGHIELGEYDRTLVEGLVMGEAGTLGYEGAALVAQAIRDSMIESGTNSVESIIWNYQYDASPYNIPSDDVKAAVSFIFDSDGSAVDHRILYFYSTEYVSNAWHESQNYVTSCGSVRFFDKW